MTNNTTNKEFNNHQEKVRLKHWILKFFIIIATILVLAFAVCLGFHYRAKVITKTVTDTVTGTLTNTLDGLMDNVTADPEEGTDQLNTFIR